MTAQARGVGRAGLERVEVAPGVELRIVRHTADASPDPGPAVAAPVYVLVHGLASNARLWDGVARHLGLAGRASVAVDLRGHGRSDKPDAGYDFETVSGDLRALIERLGLDRPVLVGQSWGAGVVLDFGVRFPDLVRGLVMVDGGLNDLRDGFADWEACWARLAPPQLIGRPLSEIESYFRTNHSDWPEEGIEGSLANFEIRPDRTIAPWLTRDRHKAILHAMWGQQTQELWSNLRVPALIVPVDGGGDWTTAKRAGAAAAERAMAASHTSVRVVWMSGDHDVHAQHPAELAGELLAAERAGFFAPARAR